MKVTTESGFTAEIDKEEIGDNFEILELVPELQGDPQQATIAASRMAKLMLSASDYAALKEHCRVEGGRVSTKKVMECVSDFIDALGGKKK